MAVLNMLRIVADLSFYSAFAAFIASYFGGTSMLTEILFLSVCFGCCAGIKQKKYAKILLIVSAVLLLFIYLEFKRMPLSSSIVFLPPVIYVASQVLMEDYSLFWSRQVDLFSLFWKIYGIFVLVMSCVGQLHRILVFSMPTAFLMCISSVALMRLLRQEPEIYLQKSYQIKNLLLIAIPVLLVWMFSFKSLWQTIAFLLYTIYQFTIAPVLLIFSMGIGFVLTGIFEVIGWVVSAFHLEIPDMKKILLHGNIGDAPADIIKPDISKPLDVTQFLIAAGVILLVVVLICFFLRLLQKPKIEAESTAVDKNVMRRAVKPPPPYSDSFIPYSHSPVACIRRQYRKFLKLCMKKGVELYPEDTSRDVADHVWKRFSNPKKQEYAEEMRDIYIRARYHNTADKKDAERAKKLYSLLRKKYEK